MALSVIFLWAARAVLFLLTPPRITPLLEAPRPLPRPRPRGFENVSALIKYSSDSSGGGGGSSRYALGSSSLNAIGSLAGEWWRSVDVRYSRRSVDSRYSPRLSSELRNSRRSAESRYSRRSLASRYSRRSDLSSCG